jgi:hypothetical protein
LGHAGGEFVVGQTFFRSFDWPPRVQRLLAVDRPRCRRDGRSADQPHLAGSPEPAHPPSPPGVPRRGSRGALSGWAAAAHGRSATIYFPQTPLSGSSDACHAPIFFAIAQACTIRVLNRFSEYGTGLPVCVWSACGGQICFPCAKFQLQSK